MAVPANSRTANNADILDTAPPVTGQERRERMSKIDAQRERMAKMDKVPVRLQEDTRVQINQYVLRIKGKTRVMVPSIVAEVLEQSGRI